MIQPMLHGFTASDVEVQTGKSYTVTTTADTQSGYITTVTVKVK